MNYELLTDKQKEIIGRIEPMFESKLQLETWLSIPNKLFRNKAPVDILLSGNYDYFERFLNPSS
jgi:hypothetical protein